MSGGYNRANQDTGNASGGATNNGTYNSTNAGGANNGSDSSTGGTANSGGADTGMSNKTSGASTSGVNSGTNGGGTDSGSNNQTGGSGNYDNRSNNSSGSSSNSGNGSNNGSGSSDSSGSSGSSGNSGGSKGENFSLNLHDTIYQNMDNIRQFLGSPEDLVTRKITLGPNGPACGLVFLEELVDAKVLNEYIIGSIQRCPQSFIAGKSADEIMMQLRDWILPISGLENSFTLEDVVHKLLQGQTALFLDGTKQVILLETPGWKERSIEEASSEKVVRGPRDGFIENISVNLSMIRRKLMDPNLHVRSFTIGVRSRKKVAICYVAGIVRQELVDELSRRISSIVVDSVPESGTIEQWIEDSFLSPFPQLQNTERPDRAIAALVNGRAVILIDGTPFALLTPVTFSYYLKAQEDDYERWAVATFLRILRYIAAFISVFLPAFYIALIEYHHGLIPSKLAFSIAGTRESVPFPAVIEAYLMEFTMEILREAGIRLPTPVGQTIGIVGGLVIGEAAVQAGIVSPIMVIVVALTAITSFTLPSYELASTLRLLRFSFMAAAAVFGLYGIMLGFIMVCIHVTNLHVMGIPYSAPFAPGTTSDWKYNIFRFPITITRRRARLTEPEDKIRARRG